MMSANRCFVSLSTAAFLLATIAVSGVRMRAQDTQGSHDTPYLDDWTHHHLVFSDPGTREDAVRHGMLDRWLRVTNSERYQLQQGKRSHGTRPVADGQDFDADHGRGFDLDHGRWGGPRGWRNRPSGHNPIGNAVEKDWSTPLGSATAASQTGTFSGVPTAGQTATITDGANALVLTAANSTTPGTGTITDNRNTVTGSTITIGAVTYTWVNAAPTTIYQVRQSGDTHPHNIQNLYAAINGNAGLCFTSGCTTATTPAQAAISATYASGNNYVTVSNTGTAVTWSISSTTNFTLNPSTGTGSTGTLPGATATTNSCSSSTAGTFVIGADGPTTATNMISAISACETSYAAVGVTASSGGSGIATVKAATSGTGGNSITTASTLSNFNWGGGTLSGGTAARVQPTAVPAKYGPSITTASCANDFVVYPTGQAGGAGAASIIAYNNLYVTGCSGTVPSAYWAYNTGAGYSVTTSPILSEDGTMVAFVQSNGSGAQLVVLKWKAADGALSAPSAPTLLSNITACPANTACMTVTPLANNDTYSSPYYPYWSDDSIYVGDNGGNLEKITGVFAGAAGSATAVNLGNTYPLASPVYDSVSGCVFVGDTEGYLYSASSGVAGTVCTSTAFGPFGHSQILADGNANAGIFDAPIVDSTADRVYVFVASNLLSNQSITATTAFFSNSLTVTTGTLTAADVGKTINGTTIPAGTTIATVTSGTAGTLSQNSSCGSILGPYTCTGNALTIVDAAGDNNEVAQFAANTITSGSTTAAPAATETLGTGGDGYPIYDGIFDNVYYTSANATGNLYAIGNTGLTTGAILYRIPIANSVMSVPVSAVAGLTPNAANAFPWPSPLSEFCNGACTSNGTITTSGSDYLFFSVNQGSGTGCTTGSGTGCILSYNASNPASVTRTGGQTYANPTGTGCWATGGISIDNSDQTTAGASQIYFVSLAGVAAGGPNGATSSNCDPGAAPTINAIQAGQNNP